MPPGAPSPLPWFAFSLALSPEVARAHLPGLPPLPAAGPSPGPGEVAEALDVDLRYDVPQPAWGGRVARLVEAPGRRVWGRLLSLPPEAAAPLALLEAALHPSPEELPVRVRTASGAVLRARAFVPPAAARSSEGPVSEAFLTALALAAERAGLPADAVERLQAEAQIVATVQRARAPR